MDEAPGNSKTLGEEIWFRKRFAHAQESKKEIMAEKKEAPFYNEEAVKELERERKKFEEDRQRDLNDLRKLLQLPEFRRYVWRELERCGVMSESFNLNAMQMSHNEGARSIGIALLAELMLAKPDAFHQMFKEHYSEAKSKNKEETNG